MRPWFSVGFALTALRRLGQFLAIGILPYSLVLHSSGPSILIEHAPGSYSRRAGDITANISGLAFPNAGTVTYRVNGGPWRQANQESPRVPRPLLCVEMNAQDLRPGKNTVEIRGSSGARLAQSLTRIFNYDPSLPRLPLRVSWNNVKDLEVEGGVWERLSDANGGRVRPKPGFEEYDRLLIVAGAFPGGRRVTVDVTFREAKASGKKSFGFGVLPLWGGRPDSRLDSPRRGWNFSLVWYYSHYEAVGSEFSYKNGDGPPAWVSAYRSFDLRPARYTIIVEALEALDERGGHLGYRQRMQWRERPDLETPWIELSDQQGASLPAGEYAVALIAHRCQVDFGPVLIEALAPEMRNHEDVISAPPQLLAAVGP